ncbi:hypothetical protein [Corynebacterium durum]|uniref:hypothetical protein n=1 Tax=Corynebacterium durum TaxID=61592 RepID=UPI0028E3CECF|nr:hypothetical protein [Corynebacterium durum]
MQVLSGLVEAFVVELGLVFTEASALLLTPSSTRKTLINSSHNSNSGALLSMGWGERFMDVASGRFVNGADMQGMV